MDFGLLGERSTICVLPPEILAQIFKFAHTISRRLPHKPPFEVRVSHVSEKWRAVAVTTPMLWTTLSIYSPQSFSYVPTYLKRSGSILPLSVIIDIQRWDSNHTVNFSQKVKSANEIFKQLSPHIERVHKLSIFCDRQLTSTIIQNQFSNVSAPILESLSITFNNASLEALPDSQKIFHAGSSRLTFVEIAALHRLTPSINLSNVTTLFLHLHAQSEQFLYPEFVTILTTAASLVNLSVVGSSNMLMALWPTSLAEPDPDFELRNLKCLRLIDSGIFAVRFLLSVSTPKIESLWLDGSYDSFHTLFHAPQMAYPSGGTAKFHTVRYLTLREHHLEYPAEFARLFPNITHLHLGHASYHHADRLAAAISTSWNLLHSLVFTVAREAKWDQFSIVMASLLPLRSLAGKPIERVILDKDFRRKLEVMIPDLSDLVTVVDISPETYQEPWWSGQIRSPFKFVDGL